MEAWAEGNLAPDAVPEAMSKAQMLKDLANLTYEDVAQFYGIK